MMCEEINGNACFRIEEKSQKFQPAKKCVTAHPSLSEKSMRLRAAPAAAKKKRLRHLRRCVQNLIIFLRVAVVFYSKSDTCEVRPLSTKMII